MPFTREEGVAVLVVDDDRQVNDALCDLLTFEGYRVEAAFDGLEAQHKFRPGAYDVVITDVAMPRVNGWELSEWLNARAPRLPVILITGYGPANRDESDLRRRGVAALMHKPLYAARLLSVLEEVTAGAGRR